MSEEPKLEEEPQLEVATEPIRIPVHATKITVRVHRDIMPEIFVIGVGNTNVTREDGETLIYTIVPLENEAFSDRSISGLISVFESQREGGVEFEVTYEEGAQSIGVLAERLATSFKAIAEARAAFDREGAAVLGI